jgi:hypothetical protein
VSPALKTGQEQGFGQEDIFLHRVFFFFLSQEFYRF